MKSILKSSLPTSIRQWLLSFRFVQKLVYPQRMTHTRFIPEGCLFEVTTPIEKHRVFALGNEELFLTRLLQEIQQGDVFFDVGSCVGVYAIHSACLGAQVVAFEPDSAYRERLKTNISLNNQHSAINVIDWAVSDCEGEATLYTDGVQGNSPSLRLIGERGASSVRTRSIDQALAMKELPIPTLIKMDIEGAEILALRGMNHLLNSDQAPRKIFLELHPEFLPAFDSSEEECMEILEKAGYVQEYKGERREQVHVIYRRTSEEQTL